MLGNALLAECVRVRAVRTTNVLYEFLYVSLSMTLSMYPYSILYLLLCMYDSFWEQRVQNHVFAPSCIILQHLVSSCNGILEIEDEVWGEPCGNWRVAMVNLCSIPFETVQNSKPCKTIQCTQIQKLAKHIETHRKIRKKYCFCAKFGGQLWHQHIRRRDYVIQAHGRPLRDTWRSGRTTRHATRKEPSSFVVLVFIRLQQILCKALSNNLSLPLATSHNRHQLLWFFWECSECSKSEVHHTASHGIPNFFWITKSVEPYDSVWLCDSQQVNPLRRLLSSALVEHEFATC